MAEMFKVNAPVRKPLFEGVQGENEARSIVFDITPWVDELGDGAVTATAKRSQDSQPYPVTVTKDGNTVTWKPTSTDTAFAGVGSFQLEYTVDDVLAKTCIWSTMVAPSLDPAGDPPDPYDNWLAEMREIAADAIQAAQDADESADDAQAEVYEAEAWATGTKNGTPVPSTADQYENNSKYYSEESYKNAEAWAVGQRGGVDVPSTDPTYENNSKYWAEQSLANQYGAYIVKSASGDIASFNDGADNIPMKSLKVAIVPKQAGSGDPSPSNVRPITGTSTANVMVAGKNLFDVAGWISTFASGQQVTFQNDVMDVGNTAGNLYGMPFKFAEHDTQVTVSIAGVTLKASASNVRIELLNESGSAVGSLSLSNDTQLTRTASKIRFNWSTLGSGFTVTKPQIELGASASDYVPYNGHTTPVPLGQTVYGGTVDVVSGEGKATRVYEEISNSTTLFIDSTNPSITIVYQVVGTAAGFISNRFNTNIPSGNAGRMAYSNGNLYFVLPTSELSAATIAGVKEWFASHQTQVSWITPNPTAFTFTPAQVASLLGTNNVWADCGAVEVEYRADPTLAYAELEALILENI